MKIGLEIDLRDHLDAARAAARSRWHSEYGIGDVLRCANAAKTEIRPVEDIEHFGAELKVG